MKKTLILRMCALATTLFLINCAQKDADKLASAQACVDKSTAATAGACLEKISGLSSQQSYAIRCSVMFIQEGFDDPTRYISAFEQLNQNGSGNSSLGLMGVMAFKSASTAAQNQANADTALSYCQQAGSKGYIMLAAAAQLGTTIAKYGNLATYSQADLLAVITNPSVTDTADFQTAVGATAVIAYQSNCTGTNTSNQQLCSTFQSAVTSAGGTSNTQAIGAGLISALQQH